MTKKIINALVMVWFFIWLTISANENTKFIEKDDKIEHLLSIETENEDDKIVKMPVDYLVDENGKYIIDEKYWWIEGIEIYMDEVSPQSTIPFFWTQKFDDCDYDTDGLTDRVRMTRKEEGTFYYIEFGNGDLLTLGPFYDPTMGFYLTGGDLTGDGVPEMLFMGMHLKVGHPYSEFILAQKIDGEYVYMDVPKPIVQQSMDEARYEMGYDIYVLEIVENVATVGNTDLGIIEEIEIEDSSKESYENFMKHWNVDGMYGSEALYADIIQRGDSYAMQMTIECGSRYDKYVYLEIIVEYENKKWIIQDTAVREEVYSTWEWKEE